MNPTIPCPFTPAAPELAYSALLRAAMQARWLSFEAYRAHVLEAEAVRPLARAS
jgi:hypothetical protein